MSSILVRSSMISTSSKNRLCNKRFFGSNASSFNSGRDSVLSDHARPVDPHSASTSSLPPPIEPAMEVSGRKPWSFLKFGLLATLTGATATAIYATYAYTADEVDVNTRAFRSIKFDSEHGDSVVDKVQNILYSAAVTGPVKAIEAYLHLRRLTEEQVRGFAEPTSEKLLPDLHPMEKHVFTLVLDLKETLVYTDWKRERGWRTFKRPGVDAFLEHLAKFYEIVVFSDEQSMYVEPIVERLDPKQCIRYKLARGANLYKEGKHFRDLSKLNRDPEKILYVSGHAFDTSLQRENSIQIKPWKLEADDTELLDLIPFLEYVARHPPADIRTVIQSYEGCNIGREFIERSKEHKRRMQEQKQHGRLWHR